MADFEFFTFLVKFLRNLKGIKNNYKIVERHRTDVSFTSRDVRVKNNFLYKSTVKEKNTAEIVKMKKNLKGLKKFFNNFSLLLFLLQEVFIFPSNRAEFLLYFFFIFNFFYFERLVITFTGKERLKGSNFYEFSLIFPNKIKNFY